MKGVKYSHRMCGFAGILHSTAASRDELCDAVTAMADPLRHRGPDDAGSWIDADAGIALGFRRLAIIDLTAAGHQPMVSHDDRYVIVFNGEIYNHEELRAAVRQDGATGPWTGHSDTETLLECVSYWGVRHTLKRAIGMFALALWDRRDRRLHLARDRFGEKPLYYGWTGSAFLFGSELTAFQRYPGFDNPIDRDALALYMQYLCVPAPYSIYRDVYKLEPACILSLPLAGARTSPGSAPFAPLADKRLTIEQYWSLEEVAQRAQSELIDTEAEAIAQVERVLTDAVRLQSIADVPLGAFLSGGIDSSLIVALMQAQSSLRVKTFTIGFGEHGYNEAADAKAVAQHLGTDHSEIYLSADEAMAVIPQLPRLYSEPFADSSQIPTHLVSQMARQHVTVALSGDGGDEMFGGYVRYTWAPKVWQQLQAVPSSMRPAVGAALTSIPAAVFDGVGRIAGMRVARLGEKAHKLGWRLRGVNDLDDLYRTLVTTWPRESPAVDGAHNVVTRLDRLAPHGAGLSPEHRMMLWDALTYLPDDVLHKVDRASMGVSLETRAPYLDHRVAQLAWRLPLRFRIRDGQTKWIIRQLLYRYVPGELVERPKMGFAVPIDSWIRGPLRDWAEDLLRESRLRQQGYLNVSAVRTKWREHLSGRRNWQHELWSALMFQAWLE